ncbi:MAG: orotate phosphoribosyltransferase [Dehalococcoidia bacterium]
MTEHDPRRERLKELIQQKAVLRGSFTLASGEKSSYYFDGRRVTHDAEGVALLGAIVADLLKGTDVEAVGGPATGANPIVTATQLAAYREGRPLSGFFVRSEKKGHGTDRLVEGCLPERRGARVVIVDDVVTTGGSLRRAIEAVEAQGCVVAKVVVLVDRRQGGCEALRAQGYDVEALFEADAQGNIV